MNEILEGILISESRRWDRAQIMVRGADGLLSDTVDHERQIKDDLHNYGIAFELQTPNGPVRIDPTLMRVRQPGTQWRPRPDQVRVSTPAPGQHVSGLVKAEPARE